MPKQEFKIHTWTCSKCDYQQDFEHIKANIDIHFPNENLKEHQCPSCKAENAMIKELDINKRMKLIVDGDTEAELEEHANNEDKKRLDKKLSKFSIAERNAFKLKKKADISKAIAKAKLYEDKS